jgi:hypothetical protein
VRKKKKKGEKRFNNFRMHIFGFSLCSQKCRKTIKDFSTSFLIYSQIWLNIPMDDRHFLATNKKSPEKAPRAPFHPAPRLPRIKWTLACLSPSQSERPSGRRTPPN